MKKPIPKQLQRAIENGEFDVAARNMSAAFILMSVGIRYMDKAIAIIERNGLFSQNIKRYYKAVDFNFDRLNDSFFKLIQADQKEKVFSEDYDRLYKIINDFINQ